MVLNRTVNVVWSHESCQLSLNDFRFIKLNIRKGLGKNVPSVTYYWVSKFHNSPKIKE